MTTNLVFEPDEKKRPSFRFRHPGTPAAINLSWKQWADYHRALGQELAKRMWVYPGPSTEDDTPTGGTPVAVAMRRAA